MGSFVSFALIGGMSVMVVLMWRLYIAVEMQRNIKTSFDSASEDIALERQTAAELAQAQSEAIDELTDDKQALQTQFDQQITAIAQLKSDHQALQEKYSGLERDLLNNLAQGKTLSDQLQSYKLDNAKLQRQTEVLQKHKTQNEQEQQTLLTQHQAISDKHQKYQMVIQAAKEKISALEKDKKQLERDLQQALYQVVALEQKQKVSAPNFHPTEQPYSYEEVASEPSLPFFQT